MSNYRGICAVCGKKITWHLGDEDKTGWVHIDAKEGMIPCGTYEVHYGCVPWLRGDYVGDCSLCHARMRIIEGADRECGVCKEAKKHKEVHEHITKMTTQLSSDQSPSSPPPDAFESADGQ